MIGPRTTLRLALLAGATLAAPAGCALDPADPAEVVILDEDPADERPAAGEGGDRGLSLYAINNLQLASKKSESSSEWWRSPEAYCPGSTTLIGMGSSQTADGSILFRGWNPVQGN